MDPVMDEILKNIECEKNNIPQNLNVENDLRYIDIQNYNLASNSDGFQIITIEPEMQQDPAVNLQSLLKSWNLEYLTDFLIEQKVDMDVLKIIKPHHIEKIVNKYEIGIQIQFEHHLEIWRNKIGIPLYNASKSIQHSKSVIEKSYIPTTPSSSRSSPYSFSRESTPDFTLEKRIYLLDILKNTNRGVMLMEFFNQKSCFQEQQRSQLINTIAQYFEEQKIHLSLAASYKLEEDILEIFPNERLEFYRVGKRGKIYNKYINIKSGARPLYDAMKTITKDCLNNFKEFEPEVDAELCLKSLKFDNLSVQEFDSCWQACSQYRLKELSTKSIAEIFNKWSFYKQSSGYRLIDKDFNSLFGTATTTTIIDDWCEKSKKIENFLVLNVKEKSVKRKLNELKLSENCEDHSAAAILWCLHGYLVPTQKIVRKDATGKSSTFKFTIKDSQDSFIFVGKNIQEIENHIDHLKTRMENIQPFILAVSNDIQNVEECFVYLDGVKFKFPNFLRAVDICYKIFHLFNIEYPTASTHFWSFIEKYFYKMSNKKNNCSKIEVLLRELNDIN